MIERMALHDMIVKEVKKYIAENKLKIGDRLPPQTEFAKMFGLSRTSMREATRTLQAMDIIEIVNGRGMFVKNNIFLSEDKDLNTSELREQLIWILEVRRALESLAIELAIKNAAAEDFELIERNLIAMEKLASQSKPHPKYDKAFHTGIYRASKNPFLLSAISHLGSQFDSLWENPLGAGDALTEGTNYHRELFDSIKDGDKKKALEIFQKLIDQVEVIINNI